MSKKPLVAAEQETQRVKDLRFSYRLWSFTIDPRNLIFIDETGMHLGFTRLRGRAPKGERLYDTESPGNSGKNISLIGGMSVVREAIESAGAKLIFLLPYSPDLSPIELCWSKLKQLLRSAKARTIEALDQALTDIINNSFSPDDALGWFAHCGLFI